jgi:hypothetical protein
MNVLTTYHGVVEEDGLVRLLGAPKLREGTEADVVVARSIAPPEEQHRDLNAFSLEDYHRPFERFEAGALKSERKSMPLTSATRIWTA